MEIKFKNTSKVKDSTQAVESLVGEFFSARTAFHKLHLKVTGQGSYSAHKALNEVYEAMEDSVDSLAEQYQGATEQILNIPDKEVRNLNTVKEGIQYLKELKDQITSVQEVITQSEIINLLDEGKANINKFIYFLKFLS